MADIVDQRQGLRQIFLQAELSCGGTGNLRDLHGVGQATAEVIRGAAREDLSLARETAKGTSLNDALTVALERGPRRAGGCRVDAGQEKRIPVAVDCTLMQIELHGQVRV
jgi:hypothetical protein